MDNLDDDIRASSGDVIHRVPVAQYNRFDWEFDGPGILKPTYGEIIHAVTIERGMAIFDSPRRAWDGMGMSSTPTRNIALTPVLENYIRTQVASGHYSNASEVVRAGLRLLMERDEAIPRPRTAEAVRPSR